MEAAMGSILTVLPALKVCQVLVDCWWDWFCSDPSCSLLAPKALETVVRTASLGVCAELRVCNSPGKWPLEESLILCRAQACCKPKQHGKTLQRQNSLETKLFRFYFMPRIGGESQATTHHSPAASHYSEERPKLHQSVGEKAMSSWETFQMMRGNRTLPPLLPTALGRASHL